MKLNNPILITLNNTLHIKADNLEPVEVDSSCIDNLIDDVWFEKRKTRLINEIPNAINLMEGINISELSDRIEVRDCTKYINTESYSVPVVCKRAFLLPEKEDELSELLEIVDKKFYTIEEIEKAIDELPFSQVLRNTIKVDVINNLKK